MVHLGLSDVLIFAATFAIVVSAKRLAWIFKYLLNVRRQIKILAESGISGPPTYPILGNLTQIQGKEHDDIYYWLCELLGKCSSITRLWMGPVLLCCVKDPRDIELVLNGPTFSEKPVFYNVMSSIIIGGLPVLDTQTWKRHRKAIVPSFHIKIMESFVETFFMTGKKFAQSLEDFAAKDEIVDITYLCGRCANETVCRTILSSTLEDLEIPDFPHMIAAGLDMVLYRILRPWYLNQWMFSWSSKFAIFKKGSASIEHFTKELIQKRKQEISTSPSITVSRKLSFLDCMLMSTEGSAITDEEIFNEVRTLLLLGTGTSMDGLSILMYTLAVEQEIQDKVYEELRDIFGDEQDRPVTHEDLPHMEYMERVIKETIRFFTLVPYFGRSCSEDTKMPSGGTIPKGATVFFWIPQTHTDPANFPNPKVFDPDRFLPEVARTRHPYSYIPFSAGPKSCIAQRYAMMFMKTILATILRRVRLVIPEGGPKTLSDVPLIMNVTISVKGGARLKFERRALS